MKIPILNNNYLNHAADSPFNVAFTIISVISSNLWYFSFLISHFLSDRTFSGRPLADIFQPAANAYDQTRYHQDLWWNHTALVAQNQPL